MKKEKYEGLVLYIDPPWRYDFKVTDTRKIENQYPTMKQEEIIQYIKDKTPSDYKDILLVMWTTAPKLEWAMDVIKALDYDYKTNCVWDKIHIGMGYWFRGQHEHILIATKGKVPSPKWGENESSIFREKRTKHSSKPIYFRNLIDKWYPDAKKVELFARSRGKDWETIGNEFVLNVDEWM